MTIYFIEIETSGAIKIGYTAGSAEKRLAQLQTGQPLKLRLLGSIEGDRDGEIALHRELAKWRGNGEWFEPCAEVKMTVRYLLETGGPWYLCRQVKFLTMKLEAEWPNCFAPEGIDNSAFECSAKDLESAIAAIKQFNSDVGHLEEYKQKHGREAKWRPRIYREFSAHIHTPGHRAAKWVTAWETPWRERLPRKPNSVRQP